VTGEAKELPLRPVFDRRIKLEFHSAKIISDGGLLAYRELYSEPMRPSLSRRVYELLEAEDTGAQLDTFARQHLWHEGVRLSTTAPAMVSAPTCASMRVRSASPRPASRP
jgi:hypothetical protein